MKDQFRNRNYINLETFRKNGQGVKTPVWFAEDGGFLHVWTRDDSGKARRIRQNRDIKIAPATAKGDALGKWVDAQATADSSPEALKHVKILMGKKYGAAYKAFHLSSKIRKINHTEIKIQLDS